MIHTVVRYLLNGSDDQYMHPEWLQERMAEHDTWTRSQADPRLAIVVSDSAAMARRNFWKCMAEKQQRLVTKFPRRMA